MNTPTDTTTSSFFVVHSIAPVMFTSHLKRQWQKAMELFLRMVDEGKLPNKQTINILMELLDEAGQFSKVCVCVCVWMLPMRRRSLHVLPTGRVSDGR